MPIASPSTEQRVAAALRRLARRQDTKHALLEHPALYGILRRAAARYVAGETREEALAVAARLAARGHRATIDFMGEDVTDAALARAATDEFLALATTLGPASSGDLASRCSLSLDLSHVGLAVPGAGERLAREHLGEIARAASDVGREVIISMEDSARTDAILDIHASAAERFPDVGITLQASLRRTPADLARVRRYLGRVRLVKGAYAEPADRALGRGPDLDAAYLALARHLVDAAADGHRCSIATHHQPLLDALVAHAGAPGDGEALQFEMLQGVMPERLDALAASGFATRTYLVYGREWYLYLCHRLAEHPPSLFDALAEVVEGLPPDGEDATTERMIASSARPGRR